MCLLLYLNWGLIYLLLSYLCQPISQEQGIPSSASLLSYIFQTPINVGKLQPHGNTEPGITMNMDTGRVIPIPPDPSVPGCDGESTSKALGCFWYLCHSQRTLHSPAPPAHIQEKKKQTLKLFTTMDIEIIFEAL